MAREAASFLIPLALDEADALVRADDSEKGGTFRCPQCLCPILLRKGQVRRAHFAHPSSGPGCSPESVTQQFGSLLIVRVVAVSKSGTPRPTIVRRCTRCDGPHPQTLPTTVTAAVPQPQTHEGTNVLLVDNAGGTLAAIGVVTARAAAAAKRTPLDVPWFALAAEHLLADPTRWFPVRDELKPFMHCKTCAAEDRRLASRYDSNGYITRVADCFRCGKSMPVFTWRGHSLWAEQPPPDPIPASVQFRFSKTIGQKYWLNVCPSCDAIQGDFFLYHEPDGAFWGHEGDRDLEFAEHVRLNGPPKPAGWDIVDIKNQLDGGTIERRSEDILDDDMQLEDS